MHLDFRMLSAGYCHHPEFVTIKGGSWRACQFPSLFGLVRHPQRGIILFDTGYAQHMLNQSWPGRIYEWVTPVCCGREDSAVAQLARLGIEAERVTHILISHFHADHIAGLRDFPLARFWCFREAYEQVRGRRGLGALLKGFLPGLLPDDFQRRLSFMDEQGVRQLPSALQPFERAFDLFGDGSLLALPLPGHARGQMGLLLQDDSGRPVFLVADACWSELAYREMRGPHAITRLLTHSHGDYMSTLYKLHCLEKANGDIRIIPSHSRLLGGAATGGTAASGTAP